MINGGGACLALPPLFIAGISGDPSYQ